MNFSAKKLFLFGFIVVLLVGIPLTVYLIQQQQEVRSRAAKSTTLSFFPESTTTAPIKKNAGDTFTLDVMVDPGSNLVSFVKLEVQYDPEKLATVSANAFQANSLAFPSVLETKYELGKISVTLAVGPDPTKAVQQKVKAGTITFQAKANTAPGTPTLVTHGAKTEVLSIGSSDQASENVLSSALPAVIVIGAAANETPVPIPSGSPFPTAEVSPTDALSPTEALSPTIALTPTITGGGGTPSASAPPLCNSLSVDRATTGAAPLAITFTANGTATAGTVSKVTFNFGDGQVSDVTSAGGIGTAAVNVQLSHTYNNVGVYEASAVLTDSNKNISATTGCKQTITVAAPTPGIGGANPGVDNPAAPTDNPSTPTPTMASPGAANVIAGISFVALILMAGGAFLFFAL